MNRCVAPHVNECHTHEPHRFILTSGGWCRLCGGGPEAFGHGHIIIKENTRMTTTINASNETTTVPPYDETGPNYYTVDPDATTVAVTRTAVVSAPQRRTSAVGDNLKDVLAQLDEPTKFDARAELKKLAKLMTAGLTDTTFAVGESEWPEFGGFAAKIDVDRTAAATEYYLSADPWSRNPGAGFFIGRTRSEQTEAWFLRVDGNRAVTNDDKVRIEAVAAERAEKQRRHDEQLAANAEREARRAAHLRDAALANAVKLIPELKVMAEAWLSTGHDVLIQLVDGASAEADDVARAIHEIAITDAVVTAG